MAKRGTSIHRLQFQDLKDHREAVYAALRRLGHQSLAVGVTSRILSLHVGPQRRPQRSSNSNR